MHPTDLSRLIGDIYECAIAPNLWEMTLARICDYAESAAGTLAVVDLLTGKERTLVNHGIDDAYHRLYQEKYHCTDLFLHPLLVRDLGEPALSSDLVPENELLGSRIYREWASPQGFRDTLMTMLARHSTRLAFLGLTRRLDQRRYDESDRMAVRLLTPHVQRAVLIGDLLEQRTIERDRFAEVIDSIATPTIIVDRRRRILHANAAGEAMLARRRPLAAANGVLVLPAGVRSGLLDPAKGAADGPMLPETLRIGDGAEGADSVVVVMPLAAAGHGSARHGAGAEGGLFALFVQDPTGLAPLAPEVWSRLFGLTGGELRVLQGLIAGSSPQAIADLYGIAVTTVRTHLTSLFRKTGTTRQADLVTLALNAVPPVRRPG